MKFISTMRSLTSRFLHRSRLEQDMNEELRSHIEHRADDLERSGLPRAEAERRARIEFGGMESVKEECREAVGGSFIESIWQDLRLAVRRLRKSPGFTLTAIATLALAIGANAVVFAALDALVLRPLDVPQSQRLYVLDHTGADFSYDSYPNYIDLRNQNHTFENLVASSFCLAGFNAGDRPSRTWGYEVSGNYFDTLRLRPHLGRFFHASDEHGPNSAPYVVLAFAFWQTRFQGDSSVVGRTVRLNKHPFTIIGVAPPGFRGTFQAFKADFFIPIVDEEQVQEKNLLTARATHWVSELFGRLKPGVTPAQATADLNSIERNLERTYPTEEGKVTMELQHPGIADTFGGAVQGFLGGLTLLAGLILLAACANLGSLFAARSSDRSREIALRLALGSTRRRILRQAFVETVLISLAGGAVGLWGAVALLRWISAWKPFPQFPLNVPVNPDAHVYLMALLLALASGFLFGAVPVRQVLRTDPYGVIKSGARSTNSRKLGPRDLMLAVQIATCAVLVTSSFVALRGLARSMRANLGFEPRHVLLAETDLQMAGYGLDKTPAMQRRMIRAMRTIGGVRAVGLVSIPPLHMGWDTKFVYHRETTDLKQSNAAANAVLYSTSPGYFHAADTVLLSGRTFTWHDDNKAPRVAIINQELAREVFGSPTRALDGYFKFKDGTLTKVVGIVEDGKYTANLAEEAQPALFVPILQRPSSDSWLVLRLGNNAEGLAEAVRSKLRQIDPGLPSFIQTWNTEMSGALFGPRMATASLGILGLMGAMLSITGIFGMAAYSVSKRKRELGIRMALGAQRKEVLQAALGRAVKLLAFGSGAGLLLGILASRVLASIVYEATPRDPLVLAGVVFAMALIGLMATWIPAQRALSIDPATLLREE